MNAYIFLKTEFASLNFLMPSRNLGLSGNATAVKMKLPTDNIVAIIPMTFQSLLIDSIKYRHMRTFAIEKAIKKEPLTRGERSLLRPYKPFYFGRVALKGQRKGVQIKNMIYPLVPAHLDSPQASELKKMYEWMKAYFSSA